MGLIGDRTGLLPGYWPLSKLQDCVELQVPHWLLRNMSPFPFVGEKRGTPIGPFIDSKWSQKRHNQNLILKGSTVHQKPVKKTKTQGASLPHKGKVPL